LLSLKKKRIVSDIDEHFSHYKLVCSGKVLLVFYNVRASFVELTIFKMSVLVDLLVVTAIVVPECRGQQNKGFF